MLLNLMAALSLASVGAVAGIASNAQSVNDVSLDKPNVLVKRDLVLTSSITEDDVTYPVNYLGVGAYVPPPHGSAAFDAVLPYVSEFHYDEFSDFVYGYGIKLSYDDSDPEAIQWTAQFLIQDYSGFNYNIVVYVDGVKASEVDDDKFSLDNGVDVWAVNATFSGNVFSNNDSYRLWVNSTDNYASYMQQHQIVSGIASGLTSVQHYATSLVSGFDALALDNGALTNSMAFAFTLLGIGTAVGICKLTFNWITGRHGM